MIGRQLDDLNVMEQYLFDNCSDLDYTIVRPPGLTNDPLDSTRKEIVFVDKWISSGSITHRMSRANVAKFMLDILESNEYLKKGLSVDMPK
jgi:biliverdin reductase / flavin reductase